MFTIFQKPKVFLWHHVERSFDNCAGTFLLPVRQKLIMFFFRKKGFTQKIFAVSLNLCAEKQKKCIYFSYVSWNFFPKVF